MAANVRKVESATAPKLSRENGNAFKILTDVAAICYEFSRQDFSATKRDKTHICMSRRAELVQLETSAERCVRTTSCGIDLRRGIHCHE
jgi:hypothetical protein